MQVFLWLLSHNKLMTRHNLEKRKINKPLDCVFCSEQETSIHLFFDCVVANRVWELLPSFFGKPPGADYLSIARYWPANKNHTVLDSACACALWCIWKTRNPHILNNALWSDIKQVWWLIMITLKKWQIMLKEDHLERANAFSQMISNHVNRPHLLSVG